MVAWTRVGREIRSLSSPCPSNAQCLSKGGSATRSVQSLSNSCQIPVQSNTTWTDIGRKTLISSTLVLSATIYYLGQSLDKLATWTMCWHGLDLLTQREAVPEMQSWTNSGQILSPDKLWTKFIFPSYVTSQLIASIFNLRQILDIYWTSTICGLILDLLPPREEIPVKSCMKSWSCTRTNF